MTGHALYTKYVGYFQIFGPYLTAQLAQRKVKKMYNLLCAVKEDTDAETVMALLQCLRGQSRLIDHDVKLKCA